MSKQNDSNPAELSGKTHKVLKSAGVTAWQSITKKDSLEMSMFQTCSATSCFETLLLPNSF